MKSKIKGASRGRIVWCNRTFNKIFERQKVCLQPLAKSEIAKTLAFLKKTYPSLRDSFQHNYLNADFYREECALRDAWSTHARTRRYLLFVATLVGTGEIIGVASIFRESAMPTVVSGIGSIAQRWRESGLFEWMVACLDEVAEQSGVEHVVCIATVDNLAAQRVYLKRGLRVCGIVPGEDRRTDHRGRVQFVPDIYFYRYFGKAEKKQLRESAWELHPQVAALWRAIRTKKRRSK